VKMNLATWGNSLHSGEKTYPIVAQRGRWFAFSGLLMAVSISLLLVIGLNPGIDFRGGSEFIISGVENQDTSIALDEVAAVAPEQAARVTTLGSTDIRVQLGTVTIQEGQVLRDNLATAYGVGADAVSSSQIGPTWGADVSRNALQGLAIFLLLVSGVMAVYFRAWRMAVAALVALAHDLLFTIGIYAAVGFEVTPASVIGFLTILGYSLYDTVVVFDKVRENTSGLLQQRRFTYAELANLAINQTLVRSINTSVVALLPVSAILFIGALLFGAGTLKDIALALFVGMAVGTYSSIFVATPLEVALRRREKRIVEHTEAVMEARASGEADVVVAEDGSVKVGALTAGRHQGVKAQPRRKRRT